MAYSLNTDASTHKITLCSSGTYTGSIYRPSFTLSKAIMLDERLLHLCGVEIVLLKHPTFFHVQYMSGEVTTTTENGISETNTIDEDNFNNFLNGVYMNSNTITISIIDALLFNLLDFMKKLVYDAGSKIQFVFNGYDADAFIYNSLAYNKMELITKYDDPKYKVHVDILNNFWRSQDFRFSVENHSIYSLKLSGDFLAMFGLNPTKSVELPRNTAIDVYLPVYGHDYICLASNVGSNALSATCGERLQTTNLLAVIPTPNNPAQLEIYTPSTDGGKTETSTNIIDLIDLHFTDKYGYDVLSLEDFLITLVVDQVKTEDLPEHDHVSLFKVRKQKANDSRDLNIRDMNKKLRISNNNVHY